MGTLDDFDDLKIINIASKPALPIGKQIQQRFIGGKFLKTKLDTGCTGNLDGAIPLHLLLSLGINNNKLVNFNPIKPLTATVPGGITKIFGEAFIEVHIGMRIRILKFSVYNDPKKDYLLIGKNGQIKLGIEFLNLKN